MKKTIQNIWNLVLCCVISLAVMRVAGQTSVNVEDHIFMLLRERVINGAERLADWKDEAENANRKTARDFTECPSLAAQNLYTDLNQKKQQAVAVKNAAEEADRDAQAARDECKRRTRLNAQCDSSYNGLSFRATAAADTINALNTALRGLKSLKCVSGCNRLGQLVYPMLWSNRLVVNNNAIRQGVSETNLFAGNTPGLGNGLQTIGEILMSPQYCSVWKPSEYSANWNFGNGEFSERVRLNFPSCKTVESFSCCSEWDLALVLPKLQKLNLVPPDVNLSDLTVSIPNRNVEMVTGVKTATCSRAVKVCTSSSETLGLNVSADPLSASPGGCQEWVEVG